MAEINFSRMMNEGTSLIASGMVQLFKFCKLKEKNKFVIVK